MTHVFPPPAPSTRVNWVTCASLDRACGASCCIGSRSLGSRVVCALIYLHSGPSKITAERGRRRVGYECDGEVYGMLLADVFNAAADHGVNMTNAFASAERELLEQTSRCAMLPAAQRDVHRASMCGGRAIGAQRRAIVELNRTKWRRRMRGQSTVARAGCPEASVLGKNDTVGATAAIVLLFSAIADGAMQCAECLSRDGPLRGGVLAAVLEVLEAGRLHVHSFGGDAFATRAIREELRALARGLAALATRELRVALAKAPSVADALRAEVAALRAAAWPASDSLRAEDVESEAAMDAAAVALGVRAGITHVREPSVSLAQLAPFLTPFDTGYGHMRMMRFMGSSSSAYSHSSVSGSVSGGGRSEESSRISSISSEECGAMPWSPAKRMRMMMMVKNLESLQLQRPSAHETSNGAGPPT